MATNDDASAHTDRIPSTNLEVITCTRCGQLVKIKQFKPLEFVLCPACDTRLLIPGEVDQFRITGFLGEGAMGRVYEAEDRTLQRQVAIKILRAAFASTPKMWMQLEEEAKAAASVNHDRVVQIYRLGKVQARPYIVMELVRHPNLQEIMKKQPVDEALGRRVAVDVMSGLKAAYTRHLVHGDVKPANILIDGKGRAKIADFGLARFVNRGSKVECWGTPYYMAPEKCRKKQEDFRSDMYSLGATLFHATSRQPPFSGDHGDEVIRKAIRGPTPHLEDYGLGLSKHFCDTVYRMMMLDPDERFERYQDAIDAMAYDPTASTMRAEAEAAQSKSQSKIWKAFKHFLIDSPADHEGINHSAEETPTA